MCFFKPGLSRFYKCTLAVWITKDETITQLQSYMGVLEVSSFQVYPLKYLETFGTKANEGRGSLIVITALQRNFSESE